MRIPVTIKNLRFEGVTRIIMTPLIEEPPGFGAVLISFPKAPSVGIDVSARLNLPRHLGFEMSY